MQIDKLTSTNAFVITDLDGAEQASGVVRAAPKVLQGSTMALARTATYLFAVRELQVSGASAGISSSADERAAAIAAFVSEIGPRVESGSLVLDPGNGIGDDDLADLAASDPRDPLRNESVDGLSLHAHLDGLGPVIAAEAALGTLEGCTAAVEMGPSSARLVRELVARGARVVALGDGTTTAYAADGLDTDTIIGSDDALATITGGDEPGPSLTEIEASILFCGSRQGMIDGTAAEGLGAGLVVPIGCQPVSAKALAVLRRRGVIVLADFVSTAGPSFAGWPAGASTVDEVIAAATTGITELVSETLGHDEGPLLGACYRAEAFLASWQEQLPFGRPLA